MRVESVNLSASYMVLVGFVLEKPKLYLAATFLSYPFSLVVTIVSLSLMKVAQPALLYIVPIMMLAIVITAAAAGDLKTLWKTDMMMVSIWEVWSREIVIATANTHIYSLSLTLSLNHSITQSLTYTHIFLPSIPER